MLEPAASTVRAGLERGDPLALRRLLAVFPPVHTGNGVRTAHLSPFATGTVEPVAVDARGFTPRERAKDLASARDDLDTVEHERQSRLRRWQAPPNPIRKAGGTK